MRGMEERSGSPSSYVDFEGPATEGRNADVDFHGDQRLDETHASTTDPDAWLYGRSSEQGAKPCFISHVLMESRNDRIFQHPAKHNFNETKVKM